MRWRTWLSTLATIAALLSTLVAPALVAHAVTSFCRVDAVPDTNNPTASIQLHAHPNACAGAPASGGCITAGGKASQPMRKASQPMLDPRRDADGASYVYSCGVVWRATEQHPAAQVEPQPTLTQTPGNPTNKNKPVFAWQSADTSATFTCSPTSFGATDAFVGCAGTGIGRGSADAILALKYTH